MLVLTGARSNQEDGPRFNAGEEYKRSAKEVLHIASAGQVTKAGVRFSCYIWGLTRKSVTARVHGGIVLLWKRNHVHS